MNDNSFETESESENSTNSFDNSRNENDSIENQINNISVDEMLKIFKDNKSEEEIEYKTNKFIIINGDNDTTQHKNKKRGRKCTSEEEKEKSHNKYSNDNKQRKIQVHYLTFIILFINDILASFGNRNKFFNLDYEFKKTVNKRKSAELKNSSIGEIISNKVSKKFKKQEKNNNSILYEYFKTNEFLGKIFDMNYLTFFRMFYLKNDKIVDLRKFGIEKEITLSEKTETYYDLLEKLKKEEDEKYIKLIDECIKDNYL